MLTGILIDATQVIPEYIAFTSKLERKVSLPPKKCPCNYGCYELNL